jgi:hypothetical protein
VTAAKGRRQAGSPRISWPQLLHGRTDVVGRPPSSSAMKRVTGRSRRGHAGLRQVNVMRVLAIREPA